MIIDKTNAAYCLKSELHQILFENQPRIANVVFGEIYHCSHWMKLKHIRFNNNSKLKIKNYDN